MTNELTITQSLADSRNRDLATMAETLSCVCRCLNALDPYVGADGEQDLPSKALAMAAIRDRFLPSTSTKSCPDCEVCDGLRHHWIPDPRPDDSLPKYACAHCSVRGYQCTDCDGHGCLECGCEGVVEEPT